jgi:hypothetical protein
MNPYLDYTDEVAGDPSEQLYQYFLRAAARRQGVSDDFVDSGLLPGSVYESALTNAVGARDPMSQRPESTALRNADHGLQGQDIYNNSPPFLGVASAMAAPPIYNLLKLLAQKSSLLGSGLDAFGRTRMGQKLLRTEDEHPFTEASPPSWEAVKWGLRPFWGRN